MTTATMTLEKFLAKQEAELTAFIAKAEADKIARAEEKRAARIIEAAEAALIAQYGIKISDVEKTYNGATGCACGCGGDYSEASNTRVTTKRVNLINKAIIAGKAEFFGNGVEAANEDHTRVIRVYFIDGVTKNGKN